MPTPQSGSRATGSRHSTGVVDWHLGYSSGPTPDLHPGERIGAAHVLGRPPMVIVTPPGSSNRFLARMSDVVGRMWVVLAALVWIGVPVYGLLMFTHQYIFGR